MALNPNKLSRNELVQLLNSTSLGECLTRGRLNSQMNRAGPSLAAGAPEAVEVPPRYFPRCDARLRDSLAMSLQRLQRT
jgi:hypothetical protein